MNISNIDSSTWGDDPTWLTRLCGYRNRVTSSTEWRQEKLLKALGLVEKKDCDFLFGMDDREKFTSLIWSPQGEDGVTIFIG